MSCVKNHNVIRLVLVREMYVSGQMPSYTCCMRQFSSLTYDDISYLTLLVYQSSLSHILN